MSTQPPSAEPQPAETPPTKSLPANPNITQLKKQAKDLHRAISEGDAAAIATAVAHHPDYAGGIDDLAAFTRRDAQLTIARQYGFDGWHALNTEVGRRMIDERDLHRWFGVQLNNGAWDILDNPEIGPDAPLAERERFLYSAYASTYHWMQVGTVANHARGEHLISRAAALVGMPPIALRHAKRCVELCEDNPDDVTDWDVGFAHEALARALAASGDTAAAVAARARAEELTAAIADEMDRSIVEGELAREPWFGLI